MPNCDICSKDLAALDTIIIRSHEFKDIVARGFNPFKEDITFPTGLKLSSLGAAFGLSEEAQYTDWKARVFADNNDWALCERCFNCITRYSARSAPRVVSQRQSVSSASTASKYDTSVRKKPGARIMIIIGVIFSVIVIVGIIFSFMIASSRQKRSEHMRISIPAPSAPPLPPSPQKLP